MKKLYKSLMVLIVLLSTSCNKWLELGPEDGITKQEFWKTKEDVSSAVIGCYSSLLNQNLVAKMFKYGELRSDMIADGPGITDEEEQIMHVNILASNSVTSWAEFYSVINNCNTVIEYAPEVLATDNTFTQTELNGYLAEALTIRSLMYFYLARSFGDVPLKLTATSTDKDIEPMVKSSQQDVLNQIVSDLKTAEGYSVNTYGTKAKDTGRITRYTVETLLADVYLWMDQYENCITECDKVISSGKFGLIEGSSSGWYDKLFYNGNSNEGIFELQYDKDGLSNPFGSLLLLSTRRFIASSLVLEEVFPPDLIDDTNKDIRGDGVTFYSTDNTIIKYSTDYPSYVHWFVYRYADVLLMKAEACAQSQKGEEALALVKTIRTRANAVSATEQTIDPTDVNGMSDYILAERSREFAFEGKRWFDILRNAKRNNYARLDILTNMVSKTVPSNMQQSAIAKFKDIRSHYFPIYTGELFADSKLIQNPFYN